MPAGVLLLSGKEGGKLPLQICLSSLEFGLWHRLVAQPPHDFSGVHPAVGSAIMLCQVHLLAVPLCSSNFCFAQYPLFGQKGAVS